MLRLSNKNEYLTRYRAQYLKLYSGEEELYYWATKPNIPIFRRPDWTIAPLAGDPWRAMPVASDDAEVEPKIWPRDPHITVDPPYRRHMFRRYWRPWTTLLEERGVRRLVFSIHERLGDWVLGPNDPCCADCDLDWTEIGKVMGEILISIADSCAVFSMSDDWALYCWEGFSVLGGTRDFMVRYGELCGGWDLLRADFTEHLMRDYDFVNHEKYRVAVEQAFARPDVAWSKLADQR